MSKGKAPVVMIHGAFAGPWVWDGFKEKFRTAGYAVYTPALRHHDKPSASLGQTDLGQTGLGKTGLGDFAADLDVFVDGLEDEPILVGHSMGGLLAQMLASRRPARAAVLLAPSAPWGVPPSTLFEIASAQAMLLNVGFWNSVLKPDEHIAGRNALDRLPAAEQKAVLARFVPESGRAVFQVMHWGLDMTRASEVSVAKVTCPLLLLAGAEEHQSARHGGACGGALWRARNHRKNPRHEPLAAGRARLGKSRRAGPELAGRTLAASQARAMDGPRACAASLLTRSAYCKVF